MLFRSIELENTIQQVITSYFDVVRQQTLLAATGILIGIDSERVALAQARLDVGSGSRLDLLQAKIDLNEQLSMKMKQYAAMEESKDRLNYLLSRKPGTLFSPSDSMVITYHPSEDQLRNSAIQNNQAILAAQRAERISLLGMKEMKSQ